MNFLPPLRLALLTGLTFAGLAYAERADREKPVNIESTRMTADDAKQVAVFEDRVVVTQGTFVLKAERLTVRQDKAGNQFAVATGKPATFRTKRDCFEEWIEGEAERIEYDSVTEKIELFVRGRVYRDKDILRGNYIVYDQKTESMVAQESKEGSAGTRVPAAVPGACPAGRVCATLQPKPKPPPGTPTPPVGSANCPAGPTNTSAAGTSTPGLELKPAQTLANPR